MRGEAVAPLRKSIERHYDSLAFLYRTFWGEHVHHGLWLDGDETPVAAQEQLVSHLARRAEVGRRERILDVGCGYGAPARWLASNFDCRVTGITVSRAQARLARRANERSGLDSRISILRSDAAALPFGDESFDLVWVIECIEHLADKASFVRDTARILRPGGRFALCTWQRGDGVVPGARLVAEVCDRFLCPSLASAEEHANWCTDAGLDVRTLEDLTPRVRATWDILGPRVGRPWLRPLRWALDRESRRFVDGFSVIAEAYDSGEMSYGLLVAVKTQSASSTQKI